MKIHINTSSVYDLKDLSIKVDLGYRYIDPEKEKENHFLYLKATLKI